MGHPPPLWATCACATTYCKITFFLNLILSSFGLKPLPLSCPLTKVSESLQARAVLYNPLAAGGMGLANCGGAGSGQLPLGGLATCVCSHTLLVSQWA